MIDNVINLFRLEFMLYGDCNNAIVNGKDTALYTDGTGITSLSLPMSYSQDADEYIFAFTDTLGATRSDTVVVGKTNQPHFESVDCTPQFWLTSIC